MYSYIWKKGKAVPVPTFISQYKIKSVLPMVWNEHCVECAAPLCYSSCKIYKPRTDKRCLRFESGCHPMAFDGCILKGTQLTFRRWAKLETVIPHSFYGTDAQSLNRLSNFYNGFGLLAEQVLSFMHIGWTKHRPSKVCESIGSLLASKYKFRIVSSIDGFLSTIYNHSSSKRNLILEITDNGNSVFKYVFHLASGWNECFIPIEKFNVDFSKKLLVKLYMDNDSVGTLTIRNADFVGLEKPKDAGELKPALKIKCIAWDLDNTLWKGVIGDAGKEGISLNKKCLDLIKEFDRRGILQTIVSKNTYEIAWRAIEEYGLAEYFLYPAINWGRKSQSLISIAKALNINIDTFGVIDDSEFERIEINHVLPQVRTYNVTEIDELLDYLEFDVPITVESAKRRLSYKIDEGRKNILASWEGDYDAFLESCQMRMKVFRPITDADKERCLELLQRSNQYNISKEKRTEDNYYSLFENNKYVLNAFSVADKYGDYGIVGFASIKKEDNVHILEDFVMSCRVAQKKVERAFFNYYVNAIENNSELKVSVFKTEKNAPIREELKKMPFLIEGDSDDIVTFLYKKNNSSFMEENIITIEIGF